MNRLATAAIMILGFGAVSSWGADLKFVGPDFESPYYRIVVPYEVQADGTLLKTVRINGKDWPNVLVMHQGKGVDQGQPLQTGAYAIHVDYAWQGGKDYEVVLEGDKATVTMTGRAPVGQGIPAGAEGHYRVFRVEEPVGVPRTGDIHTVTFVVPKSVFAAEGFLLLDGGVQVDYQILDVRESVPPEKVADTHPVTLTYKIAFPLELPPHGKKMLLLVQGCRNAAGKPGFSVQESGKGVGKTVCSDRLALEFHPESGQINTISYVQENLKLYNKIGVVHWNPGCYIPGIAWDHSFDWKTAPGYEEVIGPYCFVTSRGGPLPTITDVNLEVKYTLIKGAPYFLSETLMQVNKDLGVVAIRNDEMVLYNELFDALAYKDITGKVVQKPLEERPELPDGFVHMTPDDVDWVGLLNTEKKYGFFSLRIGYNNSNLNCAGDSLNKAGTYFYAPSSGNYVYWVRPLLYTWAEYPTRNLLAHVRKGSFFYEKNAYIALALDAGYTEQLDQLLLKLKNPVWIY